MTSITTFSFIYKNHRGEIARRTVLPARIFLGSTEWHPEEQWLMEAFDVAKGKMRTFAMKDIGADPLPEDSGVRSEVTTGFFYIGGKAYKFAEVDEDGCTVHESRLGDAYQIVGALAGHAGVFHHPDVQRALSWLNMEEIEGEILPWPREPLMAVKFDVADTDSEEAPSAKMEEVSIGLDPEKPIIYFDTMSAEEAGRRMRQEFRMRTGQGGDGLGWGGKGGNACGGDPSMVIASGASGGGGMLPGEVMIQISPGESFVGGLPVIEEAEKALVHLKYLPKEHLTDQTKGWKVRRDERTVAVRAFQNAASIGRHGYLASSIAVDGILGRQTMNALRHALAHKKVQDAIKADHERGAVQIANVKTFTVGPETMAKVFRPAGLTNVSDLQALLDAVEKALKGNTNG